MFKCANTSLFKLSFLIDFKSLTELLDFWLSKVVSELPSSFKIVFSINNFIYFPSKYTT